MTYRIGIDVGGTHTDGALLDASLACIATVKVPTSADVMGGIRRALRSLLERTDVAKRDISLVMLGTTHCTNALVERRGLERVGVLRLARPASLAVPPLSGWPADLVRVLDAKVEIVHGGYEYDGRVLCEPDESEVRRIVRSWRGAVSSVAICGMFAHVNPEQEQRVADWVRAELGPDIVLSLSNELGTLGLLERESATVLNASLITIARLIVEGLRTALTDCGLGHVRALIGQNDGTLMSLPTAQSFPVLTMGCGPTNSLRGAAFLSGRRDGLVIDVGGTTTDIGVLANGFPRQSALAVEIGGVRTNFRMPDVLSIGIGGGTVVRADDHSVRLGPDSVGYRLNELAQSFGGETLTLTDVSIALGVAPKFAPLATQAPRELLQRAYAQMMRQVEEGIDRMKTRAEDLPVLLVGGGGVLLPDRIKGASEVIRPRHFDAANAIGVAIGGIGGELDRVVQLPAQDRQGILDQLLGETRRHAVAAGADPLTIEVIERDVIPLAYLPGNSARVRIKVAGQLRAAG